MKSQIVRLLDVFLLGPFMLYQAAKPVPMGNGARLVMFISGLATIIYNGNNYLKLRDR